MRRPLVYLSLAVAVAACSAPDVEDSPPPRRSARASGAVRTSGRAGRADHADWTQNAPAIPRAVLDRVLAAGPGWMLSKVPLEPVRGTDRKFIGFRIVSVFDGSPVASRFDLRPGDLLLQVQHQRIVTPGDLLTVYQRAKGASEIAVDVHRGGQVVNLRWPVVDPGHALPGAATASADQPAEPERDSVEP
ncbi:MAG: hypothetical protein HY902_11395 [Deltaproteobacteria bacterium]|nr:hypothetical protein [Deltaproteobacteria bacterium]